LLKNVGGRFLKTLCKLFFVCIRMNLGYENVVWKKIFSKALKIWGNMVDRVLKVSGFHIPVNVKLKLCYVLLITVFYFIFMLIS